MIRTGETICPKCGGELKYYDRVKRKVRLRYGQKHELYLRRYRCQECRALHRELKDFLVPYKRYEREIIFGVMEGLITCETLGFEDYPCELTMKLWKRVRTRIKLCLLF